MLNIIQKYLIGLRRCLLLAIALVFPQISHAYTGITIVMSTPSTTNLEFVETFRAELTVAKAPNLRIKLIDLSESEKLVVAENSELVIALGVKALEASSRLKHTTPVLGVFTPLPTFNNMLQKSRRVLGNFSAIVLDQPLARSLSLIKTVLPEARNLGVLLGPNSSLDIDSLKESGEIAQLNVLQESITQQSELIPRLNILLESTDALLAIPDTLVYTRETAQPILLTSYRYQKPVFGFSQSYVKAGALAAVYSSSKQLAKQAAEIAVTSQQAPGLLPPPQVPKYFSLTVNYQVARSLNLQVDKEELILKKMLNSENIE